MGRNKNKSKNTSPNLVPSSRLYLIPDTSTSYLPGGTGGWGINFASNGSSCSHSSPAPAWGPSHRRFCFNELLQYESSYGLQLFKHYSSVGTFLLVHSCRSRLLQLGFHAGLQVLAENLQCGLLCMGHSSCQKSALPWAPLGLHSTSTNSGVIHSPTVGISAPLWSSPWASGDSAPASEAPLSLLFLLLSVAVQLF